MAALALMSACQTVGTNDAELAASRKEFLLAQSGFKVITVTTPKQQAVNGLAQYRVSAVKYNGKLYYVFPPPRRRIRSTSGNKSNSTLTKTRSRLNREVSLQAREDSQVNS
jgi:hypothetical protein